MRRRPRRAGLFLIVGFGAIALLLVAAAIVPALVPTPAYQRWVERTLSRQLAARVAIDSFHLRLLPTPGYRIEGFSLITTAAPFQGRRILSVPHIDGSLKFFALLRGRVVTAVNLTQPTVEILHQDDTTNIEALFGGKGTSPDASADAGESDHLVVRSVTATKGQLILHAPDRDEPLVMGDISFVGRNHTVAEGVRVDVEIVGALPGSDEPNARLAGTVLYDRAVRRLSTHDLSLFLAGAQMRADASISFENDPVTYDLHLATASLTPEVLAPLFPKYAGALPGDLTWTGSVAGDLSLAGTREGRRIALHLDATRADVRMGNVFSKRAGIGLKAEAECVVDANTIALHDARISLEDNRIDVEGSIARTGSRAYEARVEGAGLDADTLMNFFPLLAVPDEATGLDVALTFSGSQDAQTPSVFTGSFSAAHLGVVGVAVDEVRGSLEVTKEKIHFPTLSGRYADGVFAGNGTIAMGEEAAWHFEAVLGKVDAARIPRLAGVLSGESSMEVVFTASGHDPVTLASSAAFSGTLSIPSGSFDAFALGEALFSDAFWKELAVGESAEVDAAEAKLLTDSGSAFERFEAQFAQEGDLLRVDELSWRHARYQAELTATIDAKGDVEGRGEIRLPKVIAHALFPNATERGVLLDREGALDLPMLLSGTIEKPQLVLNAAAFAASIDARKKPAAAEATTLIRVQEPAPEKPVEKKVEKPRTIVTETPAKGVPEIKSAPKRAARPKRRVRPPARQPEYRAPLPTAPGSATIDDTDDILKVIIGQ